MGNKRLIGVAAAVVIVGAWLSLFLSAYGLPLREDTRPQRALGERLAEETLKLGGGGRIVVIVRDTAFYKNPAFDAALKAFREAVAKSGAKIGLTHTIKVDPL